MDISRIVENEVSENPTFGFDPDKVAEALVSRIVNGRITGGYCFDPLISSDTEEEAMAEGIEAAIDEFDDEEFTKAVGEIQEKVSSHLENEVKEITLSILRQLTKDAAKKAEAEEAESVA